SFDFPLRSSAPAAEGPPGEPWDLPVLVRGVSVHARGLRPRGVPVQLALALDGVLPSAQGDSVGTPDWLISGLITRPARTPTNASRPASRLTPHSSGPVWIASPSPYDSCIRYTSPLIPAQPPSRGGPPRWALRAAANACTSSERRACW